MVVQVQIENVEEQSEFTPDCEACRQRRINRKLTLHAEQQVQRCPSADEHGDHQNHMPKQVKIASTELARLAAIGRLILRHGLNGNEATRRRTNFGEDGNVDEQENQRGNNDDDHELVHLHPLWTDAVLEIDMLVCIDERRSPYQSDAGEDRHDQQRSEDPLTDDADDEPSFLFEECSIAVDDSAQPIDGRRDEAERHLKSEKDRKDRRECTRVE